MEADDFWVARFKDNRVRGLLNELREAIADSQDPETLHKLRGSLGVGFANFAAIRERELRAKDDRA